MAFRLQAAQIGDMKPARGYQGKVSVLQRHGHPIREALALGKLPQARRVLLKHRKDPIAGWLLSDFSPEELQTLLIEAGLG